MPSRRTKLTFAAVVVVGALLVAGCGGGTKNNTWQGESTERLEGASAAVDEAAGELRLNPDQTQGWTRSSGSAGSSTPSANRSEDWTLQQRAREYRKRARRR
ncbi:MAG TPA: hypothetical protein VGC32_17845 [Solirubrobacterales bacterium]